MFEKFLFCFKQRMSAILMAYTSLISGSIGIIYFTVKIYLKWEKSDSHFLTISIFHILVSGILISALIWEKPLLVLSYEFLHISVLVSLLVFILIYVRMLVLYWIVLVLSIIFMSYWIFCIHIFCRQLALKVKSSVDYIDNDVYSVCNKLYANKYISACFEFFNWDILINVHSQFLTRYLFHTFERIRKIT